MNYTFENYQESLQETNLETNLEPKDLRAHARSDIKWKELTKVFLLFIAIMFGVGLLASLVFFLPKAPAIIVASILSIGSLIITRLCSTGIIKSFLNVKRGEKAGLFCAMDRALPLLGLFALLFLGMFALIFISSLIIALLAALLNKVGLVIGVILDIGLFVLIFWLAFRFSQCALFCVDGMGPIESLKASFNKMKGNIGKYLLTILPLIGWALLLELTISVMVLIPLAIIAAKGSTSLLIFIGVALIAVAEAAAFMVFSIYTSMVQVEFYENLIGNPMNPLKEKTTKKPAIVVGSMMLASLILTSILGVLPVLNIPLDLKDFEGIQGIPSMSNNFPVTAETSVSYPNGDSVTVTSSNDHIQVIQNGEDVVVTDGINELPGGKILRKSLDEFISETKPEGTEFLADQTDKSTAGDEIRKVLYEKNGVYYYGMSLPLGEPTTLALAGNPDVNVFLELIDAVHVDYIKGAAASDNTEVPQTEAHKTEAPASTGNPMKNISYTLPQGYAALGDTSDDSAYYYKESDYISIYVDEAIDDMSFYAEYYNAVEKTYGGTKGYYYAYGDEDYKTYQYVFEKGGKEYKVSGNNESDLITLLNTLK